MTALTPEVLRKLAADSLPHVRFDKRERHYPIRAEAWLTHATSAPWHDRLEEGDVAALAPDPHHRGTAICSAGEDVLDVVILGGPPNPEDRALRLEVSDDDPHAIGNPAYAQAPDPAADQFLSFAGWKDPAQPRLGGDADYLYRAFSELSSAMNHERPWEVISTDPNRPRFVVPQPPSPAVYCEIDWAGVHSRAAHAAESNDFGGLIETHLDKFLQVTYHFLFAARETLGDEQGPVTRPMEGQWAAISLFYPAGNASALDEQGRPTALDLRAGSGPEWVVLSNHAGDGRSSSTVHRVDDHDASAEGAHVNVWCTPGTHEFRATPAGVIGLPPDPWPPLEFEPGDDVEGLGPAVFAGASQDASVADTAWPVGHAMTGPLFIGLLILAVMWIISLITELATDDDKWVGDIPKVPAPPVSTGSEAGNPAAGAPAPGGAPGGVDAPGTWDTNDGSPAGHDVAYFDLRVISRIGAADKGEEDLQPPPWWGYTGRWGIKVPFQYNAEWRSGSRRTDDVGRGWPYWQANDLLNTIALGAKTPDTP